MDALIISAFNERYRDLTDHRHQLLASGLKSLGLVPFSGIGRDGCTREPVLFVSLAFCDDEDYSEIMAAITTYLHMFDQDYVLEIHNDVAATVNPYGVRTELGIWWDTGDISCPAEVKEAVKNGSYTRIGDRTFGIFTPAMAKAREAEDKANMDMLFGTQEYLDRQSSLARHYPY